MKQFHRWHVLVDPKLQMMLCLRVAFYWLCCLTASGIALVICSLMHDVFHPSSGWPGMIIPGIVTTLLVFPVILVDMLIISNRFVGPLRRLQKQMQQVAEGSHAMSMQFRKGDYYPELVQAWNRIVEELNELREQNSRSRHGKTVEDFLLEDDEIADICGSNRPAQVPIDLADDLNYGPTHVES